MFLFHKNRAYSRMYSAVRPFCYKIVFILFYELETICAACTKKLSQINENRLPILNVVSCRICVNDIWSGIVARSGQNSAFQFYSILIFAVQRMSFAFCLQCLRISDADLGVTLCCGINNTPFFDSCSVSQCDGSKGNISIFFSRDIYLLEGCHSWRSDRLVTERYRNGYIFFNRGCRINSLRRGGYLVSVI